MGSSVPDIFFNVCKLVATGSKKPNLTPFWPRLAHFDQVCTKHVFWIKIYAHEIRSLKCFKINLYFASKRPKVHVFTS